MRQFMATIVFLALLPIAASGEGIQFRNVGPGGGGTIGCLAFEPGNPDVAYAGLDCGGMHATTDGGATWRNATQGIVFDGHIEWNNHYGLLALEKGKVLCTSNSGKIYFSDNYAKSWSVVFAQPGKLGIGFLLRNPHEPRTLYAASGQGTKVFFDQIRTEGGGWDGTIYVSREEGKAGSWTKLNTDPQHNLPPQACVIALAVDGQDPKLLYAATDYGAYRSRDGGVSWESVQKSLGRTVPRVLVTVPGKPNLVYVSAGFCAEGITPGVYRSANAGDTWELIFDAKPIGRDFSALAVDPINPDVLYFGCWDWAGGVHRTLDGGKTWTPLLTYRALLEQSKSRTLPPYNCTWHGESIHASVGSGLQVGGGDKDGDGLSDAIWFSGDNLGLIYKSLDGGKNWRQTVMKVHPVNDRTAWQGCGESQMLCVKRILFDPTDPKIVYFTDCDWGEFRSCDGGDSWALIGGPCYSDELVGGTTDILYDPDEPKTLYCSVGYGWSGPGGVLRGWVSSEPHFDIVGGRSKQLNGLPNSVVNSLVVARAKSGPDTAKYLYAPSLQNGVYRTDLGKGDWKWQKASEGLSDKATAVMFDIVNVPGTLMLYLSTADGIFRSDDGNTWRRLTGPGSNYPVLNGVKNLAIDPSNPQRLFACQFTSWHGSPEQGLYATEDGGTTWARIAEINTPYDVTCVSSAPTATVLVASQTHGVVKVWLDPDKKEWRTKPFADASNGLANTRCWTAVADPHNPKRVFIGTHGTGIFIGEELGQNK